MLAHSGLQIINKKLLKTTVKNSVKKSVAKVSNPQKIICIIFENLFGPYFLPHQSHSYGYAPSSGENLTSKIQFKSDATYYFHITKG